jgi:hypothetical protein
MLSGCWPAQKKQHVYPPPPQPTVQLPIQTAPQRIDAPPEIIVAEPPKPEPPQLLQKAEEQPAPPPRRRIPKPVPASEQPAAAPAAPIGPPAEPPPPAPVPQLAPMLTQDQQRAFATSINSLIGRTQQNIARARTRNLNTEEKDTIARAEAFVEQAQQVRKQDPAAAKSLAERAELLSRDVAGR